MQEFNIAGADFRIDTESLSDKVYGLLEDGILAGRFPPGMSLNEVELAEMLNVSRSPVREALFRLESAGLAKKTRRSRVVAEIDPDELQNNYQLWEMTETFGAALACRLCDEGQLREIRSALDRMTQYALAHDPENYRRANYEFHECLVKPCGNPLLVSMHRDILNRIQWATHYSLEISEDIDSSAVSHEKILSAFAHRDVALTEELLEEHIRDAARRVLSKYHK